MEITTIDVGQGHLAVLRYRDESIVIDSCIPARGSDCDFVKARLAEVVKGSRVVGLMLTGFDADHADVVGVAWVLRKYVPDWVMYPKYKKQTREASRVFGVIKQAADERGPGRPLRRIPVRLDVLESRRLDHLKLAKHFGFEAFSPHADDLSNSNNGSLVVRVTTDDLSYLVTGDTELVRWASILKYFSRALKSDVLQAPHHGSKNAISADILKHVKPHTVLISAGRGNQFGHPHAEALQFYKGCGARVFATTSGTLRTFKNQGIFWDTIETRVLERLQ